MRKPMKDGDRLALVERFGYTVIITPTSLDSPLPVFHRYGAEVRHLLGEQRGRSDLIALPVVHAAAFAIPCTICWPEQPPREQI